jgi:glycosyltransferase involved in cell wall biosynthesis
VSIRIANIIEEGKLGGPQLRIIQVAAALRPRFETTVIMPRENSELFREKCDVLGIPYKTLWMSRLTKEFKVAFRYLLFSVFEIAQLVRYFRQEKFDLVHVSGGSWQYKGLIAGKLSGTKVVWHLNDTYMPWVIRKLFGLLSFLADGYIYSSNATKEYYDSYVKKEKPGFVILPPVDTTHFNPSQQYEGDEGLVEKWEGMVVVGTIANINPLKGFDVFIRVAGALNRKFDNVHFVVVGHVYKRQHNYFHSLQKMCEQLSVSNLDFVGGRKDVRPILKRFDVFACSSPAESGPMTLFEAMAMRKPVVSTNVGDVGHYVSNGHNGYIVDVGDWETFEECLAKLVADKKNRLEFGQRSGQIAVEKLDIANSVSLHLMAYSKFVN